MKLTNHVHSCALFIRSEQKWNMHKIPMSLSVTWIYLKVEK